MSAFVPLRVTGAKYQGLRGYGLLAPRLRLKHEGLAAKIGGSWWLLLTIRVRIRGRYRIWVGVRVRVGVRGRTWARVRVSVRVRV